MSLCLYLACVAEGRLLRNSARRPGPKKEFKVRRQTRHAVVRYELYVRSLPNGWPVLRAIYDCHKA